MLTSLCVLNIFRFLNKGVLHNLIEHNSLGVGQYNLPTYFSKYSLRDSISFAKIGEDLSGVTNKSFIHG